MKVFKCDHQKGGLIKFITCEVHYHHSTLHNLTITMANGSMANGSIAKVKSKPSVVRLVYLRLLTARSKVSLGNGRDSSSPTTLYVGTPGAEWLVSCNISREQ